jgi:hypothetical protein
MSTPTSTNGALRLAIPAMLAIFIGVVGFCVQQTWSANSEFEMHRASQIEINRHVQESLQRIEDEQREQRKLLEIISRNGQRK